jgi:hypothetical protein
VDDTADLIAKAREREAGDTARIGYNDYPLLLDVLEAAERRQRAEDDLGAWEEAHGYIINSERDALAGEIDAASDDLRVAIDAWKAAQS